MNWVWNQIKKVWSWTRDKVLGWWHKLKWYDLVIATCITILLLPLEEVALLLSAPVILTGIPQIDLVLGICTWLGTVFVWSWVREVGMVLVWLAGVRISQIIRDSCARDWLWHRKNGLWWLMPITMVLRAIWDLIGAFGSRLIWRYVATPIEDIIKANKPENPWHLKPPPKTGGQRKKRKPKQIKSHLSVQRVQQGKGIVEFHLTPRSGTRSKEELVKAQATFLHTGKIPKGFRLHSDIRVSMDGKVKSMAYPKAKLNSYLPKKRSLVIDSSAGHGNGIKNAGEHIGQKDAVYIPPGYGHGISWVAEEQDILYWTNQGNLHTVWGEDVFVTIQTDKGLLMFKKDEKLPSYTSVVKGRSWNFKDISGKDEFEALIANPNARIERKYPDHFHVMIVDKEGQVKLYSRRPSVTGKSIDKSLHVPHLSHIRVPKKYWDSEFEVGLYMDKDMPAVEAEQLGAGILNSHPARAVKLQQEQGQLKLKLFGARKLRGKKLSVLDRDVQESILHEASEDVRPDGKLIWHIPKQYPIDAKLRQQEVHKALKAKEEGQVIWVNGMAYKHKPEFHSDLKIVAINRSTNARQGAGSFVGRDPNGVESRISLPVPHSTRREFWAHRDDLIGRSIEVKHRDTPEGQALQDARYVKFID